MKSMQMCNVVAVVNVFGLMIIVRVHARTRPRVGIP